MFQMLTSRGVGPLVVSRAIARRKGRGVEDRLSHSINLIIGKKKENSGPDCQGKSLEGEVGSLKIKNRKECVVGVCCYAGKSI
ncbi:hypothetical protein CEXT_576331 [Caerostris extrusa]|uniref:Uncharacterized protein n=1 Tax=Caerostris extrusa TaxID=172846 RepID=A0AAV4QKA1_CAEEX|nr:hypothetical protein CEXT_576331 [Caerostris extrusa]